MTTLILAARREAAAFGLQGHHLRLLPLGALLLLLLLAPGARPVVLGALADAYLQVSVFVAATLILFHALERCFSADVPTLLERFRPLCVPIAACLGATPGCGGAVIVITQFARGSLSFGAVVAVLTATMGDAAFLLLAREPATGGLVITISLCVGIVSGYLVDLLHDADFLRPPRPAFAAIDVGAPSGPGRGLRRLWLALFVPGLIAGVAGAFQIDLGAPLVPLLGFDPLPWLGLAGALLALGAWAFGDASAVHDPRQETDDLLGRAIATTHFVTVWVILAYLAYELSLLAFGLDLAALFEVAGPLLPLMGVLVGFVPGCGPQIMVTTLYLAGALPLSVQLANAISNDGDALFPVIALAPRTAVIATLYSSVPALIVGYAWYAFAG